MMSMSLSALLLSPFWTAKVQDIELRVKNVEWQPKLTNSNFDKCYLYF